MKIIAGRFKQRRLFVPEGNTTRPTLGRTRESLFNILQGSMEDARVLDLFAGSGALGFEALSRGAQSVVFCDVAADAVRTVQKNIRLLKVDKETQVIKGDWSQVIRRLENEGKCFDIIFIDPPYAQQMQPVLDVLDAAQMLSNCGIIIAEHTKNKQVSDTPHYRVYDSRIYGDTILTFMERKDNDEGSHLPRQL